MDPVKEFFADLKSPDPSIRFSALSRIEDLTWDDQQQQALRSLIDQEKDPGIRFHMLKVLARLGQSGKSKATAAEIEELLKDPDRDEMKLAIMLESVKRTDAPLVVISLKEANWTSFSAELLPSVLKFLKKFGSFENAADIEMLCRHHDPRVLSSAVEALEKIAPDRLKDLIVPLLVNPNFGIRSRAVRLLHRWDPTEALRHFESMLFSNVESEKQAALFHAYFFPFKQIETLMLRFISMEKDPDLIKKAGLLFMANPNGQVPARLLEARQACVGTKFQLIDNILKGVLTSLYQAKIVKATPEQMLEVLENHFKQKRLKLFIERYSLGLKSGAAETRLKAAIKLCDLVRYNIGEARELIENYLQKEKDEESKARVAQYYRSCLPESPEKTDQPPEKHEAEQQIGLANSIDEKNFTQSFAFAQEHFKELSVPQQVMVLKAIERFGDKKQVQLPTKALKSENSEVLAAAIDCLSVIDPDQLSPYLPQFIKHSSDDVREAAIKVFALFDKQQAIALVEKMLFSVQPLQRKQAILCCGHFDFQSVRHLLIKALKLEGDPENQQQICSLLRSNADEELFYKLYSDLKACKTSRKSLYEELVAAMADQLSTGENALDKQKLYEIAIQKLEEEEKFQSQRQAYRLEKIQQIREKPEKGIVIDAGLARFTVVAYSIGIILTALIWFLFLAPDSNSKLSGVRSKTAQSRLLNKTVMVQGTISYVDNEKRLIEIENSLENKKKYRLKIPESFGKLPNQGEQFHAQVKIIKEGPVLLADMLTAL
jgi:HEAT repeat protein